MKNRAIYLMKIIGDEYFNINPPDGGWKNVHTSCVLDRGSSPGKFIITKTGNIDYLSQSFSILNIKNFSPLLMKLAILQLEERVRYVLAIDNIKYSNYNNLYHLLMKIHEL